MFDEQVARTKDSCKDDYKFSTAKDPLFNSNHICKVEDHCGQEHRCYCLRTDRNLSMLEKNLKGQYRGTTEGSELCGVMYVKPSLKSHAGSIIVSFAAVIRVVTRHATLLGRSVA